MKRKKVLVLLALACSLTAAVAAGAAPVQSKVVAAAATRCPAFVHWEDWPKGFFATRVHAYVDFHPSDLCNGRHVKDAFVHIWRTCRPAYDSGRIYTAKASSPSDTRLYSVSKWA